MKKIFSVPSGVSSNINIMKTLVHLYSTRRDLFRKDSEIGNIYDAYTGIWTGGRSIPVEHQDYDFIRKNVKELNDKGIPFRQIFSNLYIDNFLDDERCNTIMSILNESGMNSVTLASDYALKVLKNKYSNLQYSSSVTKMILHIDAVIEELQKDYDDVCLWISLNSKKNLESIPFELRHKVSLLVCQNCDPACKYSFLCHLKHSIRTLEQYNIKDVIFPNYYYKCYWDRPTTAEELLNQSPTLHHNELDELVKLGYNHFKITGRCSSINHVELLKVFAYYLVDPDKYQEFFDLVENYYNPLRDTLKIDIIRKIDKTCAINTLNLIEDSNNTHLLSEIVKTPVPFDTTDIIFRNIIAGLQATEIQSDLVYLENDVVSVIVTTINNSNFTPQKNYYEDLKLRRRDDVYRLASTTTTGSVPEGVLSTCYGSLDFIFLETTYPDSIGEYRSILWNDCIIFNIFLRNQTSKSRFVSLPKIQAIIDYLGQYITNVKIDVDWLNYALKNNVGVTK